MNAERQGNLNTYRRHEQHNRGVVQHRRGYPGYEHQDRGHEQRVAPGQPESLIGHPLEHTGLAHDGHENHHRHQQEDHIEIDVLHRFSETDDPVVAVAASDEIGNCEHRGNTKEGRDRLMQHARRDHGEHKNKDAGGKEEGRVEDPGQCYVGNRNDARIPHAHDFQV